MEGKKNVKCARVKKVHSLSFLTPKPVNRELSMDVKCDFSLKSTQGCGLWLTSYSVHPWQGLCVLVNFPTIPLLQYIRSLLIESWNRNQPTSICPRALYIRMDPINNTQATLPPPPSGLIHTLMNPSPLGLLIAILLATTIPIFLHTIVFRSAGLTTLPSILLVGPSGSGKTALVTLV